MLPSSVSAVSLTSKGRAALLQQPGAASEPARVEPNAEDEEEEEEDEEGEGGVAHLSPFQVRHEPQCVRI